MVVVLCIIRIAQCSLQVNTCSSTTQSDYPNGIHNHNYNLDKRRYSKGYNRKEVHSCMTEQLNLS